MVCLKKIKKAWHSEKLLWQGKRDLNKVDEIIGKVALAISVMNIYIYGFYLPEIEEFIFSFDISISFFLCILFFGGPLFILSMAIIHLEEPR